MTTAFEIAEFWKAKRRYEEEDIFPNLEVDEETKKEMIHWFHSSEYYDTIMALHNDCKEGGMLLQFIFFITKKSILIFGSGTKIKIRFAPDSTSE